MLDLIDRLKKATGPDRHLDFAIHNALFPPDPERVTDVELPEGFGDDAISHAMDGRPNYTGSIDDALALIPPLTWLEIETGTQTGGHNFEWPIVACGTQKTGNAIWKGQAATLAITISIAALEARSIAATTS